MALSNRLNGKYKKTEPYNEVFHLYQKVENRRAFIASVPLDPELEKSRSKRRECCKKPPRVSYACASLHEVITSICLLVSLCRQTFPRRFSRRVVRLDIVDSARKIQLCGPEYKSGSECLGPEA